jgi:hypothetical protein
MSKSEFDPYQADLAPAPGARFTVTAEASPGVMPRVLEPFAKRGLVPTEWRSRTDGTRLVITVRMTGMEPRLADHIAACMRGIHLVDRVLVTAGEPQDMA